LVGAMKTEYATTISDAMKDGWVDTKHQKKLIKTLDKSDVAFFSPFGKLTNQFSGARQDGQVVLPIMAGPALSVHELGHAFAGVDVKNMDKYLGKHLGKEAMSSLGEAKQAFYTILDEGFNEHMTVSLLNGDPEVISPKSRQSGTQKPEGIYAEYRETFATLVNGNTKSEALTKSDLKALTSSMIEGDFTAFADFVNARWDGRDVITEAFQTVATQTELGKTNSSEADPARIAQKIIDQLTETELLAA
ncbi:MAG: hypothetical protein ACMG55_09510, partial [Microcoleus sp.]